MLRTKLMPVYSNKDNIVSLCELEDINVCDYDDDCSVCEHNKINEVLKNIKDIPHIKLRKTTKQKA